MLNPHFLHRWVIRSETDRAFSFWHVAMQCSDLMPLWEDACAAEHQLFTNLRWENGRFVVEPSPLYVDVQAPLTDPDRRFEQARDFLVDWFERRAVSRRLVNELPTNTLPPHTWPLRPSQLRGDGRAPTIAE